MPQISAAVAFRWKDLWRRGRPVVLRNAHHLLHYPFREIIAAIHHMEEGRIMKPVLLFD
jgi:hypothetical protein